jgi:hypothetical protein
VFKNYLGELSGDYDSMTHSHQISYKRCTANKDLHTQGNPQEDSHWMNLASLEVDKEAEGDIDETESDEFFSFWVKACYAQLPFITQHLFGQDKAEKRKRAAPKQTSRKQTSQKQAKSKNISDAERQAIVRPSRSQRLKTKMMEELKDLM